jgi:hypothetical protein
MPSDRSPPPKPQRKKPSIGKRLLLLTVTLLVSIVLAELAYRALRPRPFATAEIVTMDGRRVPNSEIAHFLRTSNQGAAAQHPRGKLKPGLQLKQWYDRPTQPERHRHVQ